MSQAMMSVSSLNTKIKSLLEATFMHMMVEGEVASVTYHTSGHLYFSIKDEDSSIKCVMWRSAVSKMKFQVEKGMHIVVEGSVSVYTPRGEYQFQTAKIEPYGKGALALAYEQLKERLKAKGYFEAQRKKNIPKHIQKIALVTAKESAALYDMLKIIEQRWALLEVVIVDTLVQGEMAASQIARSLNYADTLNVDVVIVGRGGGSTEDLWSFNEEIVADTIFMMKTPVVSAVGHEVDVLISDYVADLRAPTPSAAMEMILPDSTELLYTLSQTEERYRYVIEQKIQKLLRELKHIEEMLLRSSPSRQLQEMQSKFNRLKDESTRVMAYKIEQYEQMIPEIKHRYKQQMIFAIDKKQQHLDFMYQKIVMNNPKLQCKTGWAQVSLQGKTVNLDALETEQKFTLEDKTVRLEVLCLSKLEL